MTIINNKLSSALIAAICLASLGIFLIEPIAQAPSYHLFADGRSILGVPNFWNVLSNLAFLLVGLLALKNLLIDNNLTIKPELRVATFIFFIGISLVAFGSGYYHLWPSNQTLLWDRLPMTIAFMALFSIIIGEFISLKLAKTALLPLLLVGAFSVFYWSYTESQGQGDLRLYVLVQFLPILLIPVILLLFKSPFSKASGYWWLFATYLAAKFLEYFDQAIFELLPLISGHSLKHLTAAFGVMLLLDAYQKRSLL
ncbi:MAG: alkaline phytoceramidase [Gammaproteobacteria bacterium]|nr:MAG: alkaline phytoceramidase [Gammaproteobacteria bacterium]